LIVVDVEEEDLVAVIITAGGDIIVEEVIIAVIMDHVDFMDLFMVRVIIIIIITMDPLRQHQKMWLHF